MRFLKKCFYYLKIFILNKTKKRLIVEISYSIKLHGLLLGTKKFLLKKDELFGVKSGENQSFGSVDVIILTTVHCIFVANLLKKHLDIVGIKTNIIFKRPNSGFTDCMHYVICPQVFNELPKLYVAFQMEQTTNSRWFNKNYLHTLEKSFKVIDYSLINIEWLLKNGFEFRELYYLPIGYFQDYSKYVGLLKSVEETYDVLIYGDMSSVRRKTFVNKISKYHKVKIVSGVFGRDVLEWIISAKLIINVHYYDNSLLETTRIYECLSLNKLIISEKSMDQTYHNDLVDIVDFVDTEDVNAMLERINYWLSDDVKRLKRVADNKNKLLNLSNKFNYYFYRFLLANNWINYDTFYSLSKDIVSLNGNFVALTLPEVIGRSRGFLIDNNIKYNESQISVFNGLRHNLSWIGCGLSFKFMINLAKDKNLDYLIICEDDVEFEPNFYQRFNIVLEYLLVNKDKWDIFSGIVSDLHPSCKISAIETYKGEDFVYLDKMMGMVFNVYNKSVFDIILSWDETKIDKPNNTVDKFIASHSNLKIITVNPFLVGHKESYDSVLWGFNNSYYGKLIAKSAKLLTKKIIKFKINNYEKKSIS